jgi:glutaredoxin
MKVKAYTLSTCGFCWGLKKFLNGNNIHFDYIDVDLLEGMEKEVVKREAQSYCPGCGYPIIVIDESTVIRGFDEPALREALGI